MSVRILKVSLQNFKLYKEQTFDFSDNSLVVFDGPNGFGKSSFFDAIELLITGSIRRYRSLKSLIDGRERRFENPFYYEKGDGSPIIIKALLLVDGEEICIARKNDSINNTVINFNDYKLYKLENFDSNFTNEQIIEEIQLEKYFGTNYKSDFEFIHYVEQEDTFHFIKHKKEKEKKDSIDYLFNTGDSQQKLDSLESVRKRLLSFANDLKKDVDSLKAENKAISDQLKPSGEATYNSLFERRFIWDHEEIDFNSINYSSITNEQSGVLPRLEKLAKEKGKFLTYIKNKKIDSVLNGNDLELFFHYYRFTDDLDKLVLQRSIRNEFIELQKALSNFSIDFLSQEAYQLSDNFNSDYFDEALITKYSEKLNEVQEAAENSTAIQLIYSRINHTRESLENHIKELRDNGDEHTNCLFCGYEWGSIQELDKAFHRQSIDLERINDNLQNELSIKVIQFLEFVEASFFTPIEERINAFLYDPDYFEESFFIQGSLIRIERIRQILDDVSFNYSIYLPDQVTENPSPNFAIFKESLNKSRIELEDFAGDSYEDLYSNYFSSNIQDFATFELSDIQNKRMYVDWKHSIHLNERITLNTQKIKELDESLSKLTAPLSNLNKTIQHLKTSLDEYKSLLVKDIELLFHVFSGRVMQNFHMGLGLFLVDKGDKIKFVTAPDKSFDAVFSMSTGQLSSLILSFTLALNKKYSKSKLLFIDDPVQSMDDINTAGLIDVLRNDFKDRQVFVSTHEEMMSSFIRYKYKMFDISSQRVDLSSNVI